MSRIVWDRPEERKFEAGVEQGVLYVGNKPGVPWNGLVSVSQNLTSEEVQPRYQDGRKTHNHVPIQEFESEIISYTYPEEFEECIGLREAVSGFYVDEQPRVPFGLAYRTRVGDSVQGDQRSLKTHLIYNAIATPNQSVSVSLGSNPEPTNFTWGINTAPVQIPGMRPASHFVIDSERMGPQLLKHIESYLFGSPNITPRLLSPQTIIAIADDWQVLYPSPDTYPSLDTLPGGP